MAAIGAERKLVLVTRKTRIEELVAKYNTLAQARFYIEHLGADFADYQREHATYLAAKQLTLEALQRHGRYQVIDRAFLPNFLFAPGDIVIALGQDGLVANTMKYLDGQPLLGVNPDPARYDGVLLPFGVGDLAKVLSEVSADTRPCKTVTMAQATLTHQQTLYAVNDLFIGPKSHISARYEIWFAERHEAHSSSGLIVSTGLGSTGWMRSVIAGSCGIADALRRQGSQALDERMPWNADYLQFAVREPFPSRSSQAALVYGRIERSHSLRLVSLMPEHGVIFSDGIEADYLDFNAGTEARIEVAKRQGRLVI